MTIWDAIGWGSTAILLLSYIFLTLGKLSAQRPLYHVLALLSGSGLLALNLHANVPQGVVVNGFWLLVAVFALIGMTAKARRDARSGPPVVLEGALLYQLLKDSKERKERENAPKKEPFRWISEDPCPELSNGTLFGTQLPHSQP